MRVYVCTCVYVCVTHAADQGRLGRKRDTCGSLVGGGETRVADWGGRWVRKGLRQGEGGLREVSGGL